MQKEKTPFSVDVMVRRHSFAINPYYCEYNFYTKVLQSMQPPPEKLIALFNIVFGEGPGALILPCTDIHAVRKMFPMEQGKRRIQQHCKANNMRGFNE